MIDGFSGSTLLRRETSENFWTVSLRARSLSQYLSGHLSPRTVVNAPLLCFRMRRCRGCNLQTPDCDPHSTCMTCKGCSWDHRCGKCDIWDRGTWDRVVEAVANARRPPPPDENRVVAYSDSSPERQAGDDSRRRRFLRTECTERPPPTLSPQLISDDEEPLPLHPAAAAALVADRPRPSSSSTSSTATSTDRSSSTPDSRVGARETARRDDRGLQRPPPSRSRSPRPLSDDRRREIEVRRRDREERHRLAGIRDQYDSSPRRGLYREQDHGRRYVDDARRVLDDRRRDRERYVAPRRDGPDHARHPPPPLVVPPPPKTPLSP